MIKKLDNMPAVTSSSDKPLSMAPAFKRIALYGRIQSTLVSHTLVQLISFLQQAGCQLTLEASTAEGLSKALLAASNILPLVEIGGQVDLLVVIGGEGCMLGAARAMAGSQTPILGVNRGRLGFLTDVSPQHYDVVFQAVLNHQFFLEERFLLQCQVIRKGHQVTDGMAFNDIVLHASQGVQMIEFDLSINDDFVYSLQADGLIISTPTGSTAYALSAGGPIMHPSLEAIVIVPMCPHILSSRPIVISSSSHITVVVQPDRALKPPQLSFDGQQTFQLCSGDKIVIAKAAATVRLIHPQEHTFYKSARSKLGWHSSTARTSD